MRLTAKLALALAMVACTALTAGATVPAPPVNQNLGIPDGVFNNLVAADCSQCHVNGSTNNVNRHHLRLGTTVPTPTAAPNTAPGGTFECLSCHSMQYNATTMSYDLVPNFRNCLNCHQQNAGQASVHHLSAPAQAGNCKQCHGFIDSLNNPTHTIPTYSPSLVTPYPSVKGGVANAPGTCTSCHRAGANGAPVVEPTSGVTVYTNSATHHSTGFFQDSTKCFWCHDTAAAAPIRACEKCHGIPSLHNIQFDNAGNGIIPGQEAAGYGHIGAQADCNGCHGFSAQSASAPGSGPILPAISGLSASEVKEGQTLNLTIDGASFINSIVNPMTGTADITVSCKIQLVDENGNVITLDPVSQTPSQIQVVIPSNLLSGKYVLTAVKGPSASNPVVFSVIPAPAVAKAVYSNGTLTITGSDLGSYLKAVDAGTSVTAQQTVRRKVQTVVGQVISWNSDQIVVKFASAPTTVTVNTVYGKVVAKVASTTTKRR